MKKTWHEQDQRKMTPLFVCSLLVKLSEEINTQYLSVLWMLVQNNFLSLAWEYCFVAPIEVTSAAVVLPSCFVTITYLSIWASRGTMRVQHNAVTPIRGLLHLPLIHHESSSTGLKWSLS